MAYTKQTWQCGDTISAEKLNHMEDGISDVGIETNIQNPTDGQTLKYDAESGKWVNGEGGGSTTPLIVNSVYDETQGTLTLDHTWQEINAAFPNVWIDSTESENFISKSSVLCLYYVGADYLVRTQAPDTGDYRFFTTRSADGYPMIYFD